MKGKYNEVRFNYRAADYLIQILIDTDFVNQKIELKKRVLPLNVYIGYYCCPGKLKYSALTY